MPLPVDGTQVSEFDAGPIPVKAGVGLRHVHFREIVETKPEVAWFEGHSENFFGKGGAPLHYLEKIRRDYPVSFHGVGLSLGSADPLDREHLKKLKTLVDRFEPGLVSEHVSWSRVGGAHLHDLLPMPYTGESLEVLCRHVEEMQEFLGRQILIENPSSYLAFTHSDIPEAEFLTETVKRTGCRLLLDVNNIYVSSRNLGLDAEAYLQELTPAMVGEIHLAGYHVNQVEEKEVLIDDHGAPVYDEVWSLYDKALAQLGPVPTLIEWDTRIPPLEVLLQEAAKAQARLDAREQGENDAAVA